jgi:glycosyltransferase involved in cell wall biosynthesis
MKFSSSLRFMESDFDISIIVPTFNRAASLKRLLRSLDSLDHADLIRFEVLAVDNGSTDETPRFLLDQRSKLRKFSLRVLLERQRGKARALNLGLNHAKGRLVLFVDDDVVVERGWLIGYAECYEKTVFDAIQGRVLPGVDPEGKPADPGRIREYNIPIVDYGDEIMEIRGLTGTNMSLKREVFERVGYFDVRLGPGAAGFSEDTEYSMRIRNEAFRIGYTPSAVVYHELDPGRYGGSYNRIVQYRKGISRSIYRRDSLVFNVLPNLFVNSTRWVLYRLFGRSQKAYRTEGRVMEYWGYLVGRFQRAIGKEPPIQIVKR